MLRSSSRSSQTSWRGVARILVLWHALQNEALELAAGLLAHEAVGVFLHLDGAHVLVGELAAHEGARLFRRADALDPLERRKIEPLVVRPGLVGVDEEPGSLDVARAVEDEDGPVAVVLDLDDPEAELPLALLPPLVAERHRQVRGEVAETLVALAGLGRDPEPALLGALGRAHAGRPGRQGENGETDAGKRQRSAWVRNAGHRFLLSQATGSVRFHAAAVPRSARRFPWCRPAPSATAAGTGSPLPGRRRP